MSRSEMIDAFLNGTMNRKDFIRGLVASGVALGGAAAHAAALQPRVAGAQEDLDDYYMLTSKDQCMNGGYQAFGFKNQGQCIRFVNTGKTPAAENAPQSEKNQKIDEHQFVRENPGSPRPTR